jgi:hypothetical protein
MFVIEKWTDAKGRIVGNEEYDCLDKCLRFIIMILFIKIIDNRLELTVNTLDGKYLELVFINPQINLYNQ